MKATKVLKLRSVFTSGINLGGQVHRPKKGPGSYLRKNKNHLFGYEDR